MPCWPEGKPSLARRLTKLDDPDIGRITRVEKELGWAALVRRSP